METKIKFINYLMVMGYPAQLVKAATHEAFTCSNKPIGFIMLNNFKSTITVIKH